jgi:GT2 family glycosyltransferase
MITVSIIILSYNTEALLQTCLQSIFRHVKQGTFEVIVVDNNSADGSVAMVKKEFPQVRLIENKENAGFAKGCNTGAAKAKGNYLLFLNSDVELTDDAIAPLVAAFEKHSNIAVVGGLLDNSDGSRQRSFGAFYSLPNVFLLLFGGEKGELSRFTAKKVMAVDWVSGGFMLVKKADFEEIKGFDEHFFMYIEDMEFCYRMHLAGKTVLVVPSSTIKHVGHGSSNRTFAIVSIYKGLQYFYKKHKNPLQYSILVLLLGSKAFLAMFIGVITGKRQLVTTYQQALRTL